MFRKAACFLPLTELENTESTADKVAASAIKGVQRRSACGSDQSQLLHTHRSIVGSDPGASRSTLLHEALLTGIYTHPKRAEKQQNVLSVVMININRVCV